MFTGLSKLEFLDLTGNGISNLDASVFNSKTLITLLLTDNNLRRLDANSFVNASQLVGISLNRNRLVNLDINVFKGLDELLVVYFGENQISIKHPDYIGHLCEAAKTACKICLIDNSVIFNKI